MSHLRAVDPLPPEPFVDIDELRARVHSADTGCLVLADRLVEEITADPGNILGRFVVAQQYTELRRTAKRLRAWLAELEGVAG